MEYVTIVDQANAKQKDKAAKIRAALDALDDILVVGDGTAKDLWTILSALRGPDEKSKKLVKDCTTSVLRAAAFPMAADSANFTGGPLSASMGNDDSRLAALRTTVLVYGGHFEEHSYRAFLALGLKWNKVNPPVK